jgi:hypothetical protein
MCSQILNENAFQLILSSVTIRVFKINGKVKNLVKDKIHVRAPIHINYFVAKIIEVHHLDYFHGISE